MGDSNAPPVPAPAPAEPLPNPYVGPRPFAAEEAINFRGREEEARQLASLVIAQRAVVLHALSGAGKTSLIQAGLLPILQARKKVHVLPISRVSGHLLPGVDDGQVNNIYVFNTLVNLHGINAQPSEIVGHSLSEGLRAYLIPAPDERRLRPRLLILDQFEELFTTHPARHAERADFFRQLQNCLADYPQLSLLLSMREDYLARLDSYAIQMPDRLRTRFGIERLSLAGALAAVQEPAAQAGRPFAAGIAEALVDNLRRIQTGQPLPDATMPAALLGQYVEPVHLQIVCRQLWDNLPAGHTQIQAEDVQEFGDVDQALISFYESALHRVITEIALPERRLRTWFETQLITPARTRGLVYRGVHDTEGLDNAAIEILNNAYIIRADLRGSDTWYELAHDRLVEPILAANQAWRATYFNPLAAALRLWTDGGRTPDKLLRAAQLVAAQQFAEQHPDDITLEERELLERSNQQARFEHEQAQQAATRRRNLVIASLGVMLALTLLSLWAVNNAAVAHDQKAIAETAATVAIHAQATAEAQAQLAHSRELAAAAISNLTTDPELSILLAMQAVSTTYTAQAEDALHQAIQASRIQWRLAGHTGAVNAVAFSPDGHYLATAGADGVVQVWDAITKQVRLTIPGRQSAINDIAFSPNGRWLATVSDDGYTKLWDIANATDPEEMFERMGHNEKVKSVTFSRNGRRLATSGFDGTIKIWSLAATSFGLPLTTISDSAEKLITYALAFSPDGAHLATGRVDGSIALWDLASSQKVLTFPGHKANIFAMAFSPDGTQLLTGAFDSVKIWDSSSGQVIHELFGHTAAVRDVAFSADGLRVATASEDQRVKIWNVASGQEELTLAGHKGAVYGVAFSPASAQLATASADGTARVWQIGPSRELVTLFDPVEKIDDAVFTPDGVYLTTLGEEGTLTRWDLVTGHPVMSETIHPPHQVGRADFSSDGSRLAVGILVEPPSVWHMEATGLDDISRRVLTLSEPISQVYEALALNSDGTKLATSSRAKPIAINVWDTTTGKLLLTLPSQANIVHALDFSPDSALLAAGGADQTVRIWDAIVGRAAFTLTGHTGEIWDVAFSPDGQRLASASYDGTAKLWNIATAPNASAMPGALLLTLTEHTARVASVRFSPDGTRLITTSGDKTTKIWDVISGDNLLTLGGHTAEVHSALFSQDGLHLATIGADQMVRLYTLDRVELLALAHSRVTRTLTNEECQRYLHRQEC